MKRVIDEHSVRHLAAVAGVELRESELAEFAGELSYFIDDICRIEISRDTEPAFTFQLESSHGQHGD